MKALDGAEMLKNTRGSPVVRLDIPVSSLTLLSKRLDMPARKPYWLKCCLEHLSTGTVKIGDPVTS
jgi:hypothetical protein